MTSVALGQVMDMKCMSWVVDLAFWCAQVGARSCVVARRGSLAHPQRLGAGAFPAAQDFQASPKSQKSSPGGPRGEEFANGTPVVLTLPNTGPPSGPREVRPNFEPICLHVRLCVCVCVGVRKGSQAELLLPTLGGLRGCASAKGPAALVSRGASPALLLVEQVGVARAGACGLGPTPPGAQ